MNWLGKLIGGVFGYMLGGPLGAILGLFFGHSFDKGVAGSGRASGATAAIQTAFFNTTFAVMGHMAKADGQVSRAEIRLAEQIMDRMSLDATQRERAKQLFNEGKSADFDHLAALRQFQAQAGRHARLLRVFVEIQLEAAQADGVIHAAERELLLAMGRMFGFSAAEMAQLEALTSGSGRRRGPDQPSPVEALTRAYQVLGVARDADDAAVKKAYRRLLSQHHPDKLVAKGLPEEMMNMAKEKTVEIRQAYERIMESRGLRH